jgi:Ca-activated chloride channel family protein
VKFSDPLWLAAGFLAVIVLIWMWQRYDARQQAALARFVSAHLRDQLTRSISRVGRRVQRGLFLAAFIGLFITLAGPLVGFRWEQISRRGNEVIFAIDTSRSMLTPDVKPNRLTRAKLAIDDFAKRLDGDAVGIVAFAGTAFLTCPLTLDYGAFHESLGAVDTNTIPRGGTNIANAIQAAQAALHRRPGGDKILILVTDGEDLEGNALEAARSAGREGLKIYTVGVGTPAGDLIPISPQLGGGFVKDETGSFVKSRLDESGLKAIAEAAGGIYAPLGAQGEGLDLIFNTALGSIAKHELASRRQKIYTPRYQWPLAASLATLLASLLIGTRRRRSARRAALSAAAITGLAVFIVLPIHATRAEGEETPGAAVSTARDSKKPLLEYNAGTAAYRAGEFPQAAQAFQQSISHSPSGDPARLADQQDAYYNLGNSLYRAGQRTEKSSSQETLQKWNDAVKAYDTALQLRASDADAKFNRDLVKRKIDELNQQQNQNQNNNQNQNKDQNQKNNQDQQQNKDQKQDSSAKNNDPKQGQGQPPPPGQGQPPPPGQGQPPPQGQGQPPSQGQQPQSNGGEPPNSGDDARAADNQRAPGQMSREEARELLDSVKGDERRFPGVPLAQRNAVDPPEKPYKNW